MRSNLGFARLPFRFACWKRQWAGGAVDAIGAGPASTKGCCKDESIFQKVAANVAATEERIWGPELGHVRSAALQTWGLATTREEPGLDKSVGPLHSVRATVVGVERRAKVALRPRLDPTANEVIHVTIVDRLSS